MKQTIEVQRPGKSPSRVVIGDVINSLENYLPEGKRVVVIADEHVFHAYRPIIGAYDYCLIGLGETNKTLATAQKLYGELLALGADRSTFILGFGGGIVTDIAGFVASTYMRGLPFGFVASTLLAQVDASVGGKNGVRDTRIWWTPSTSPISYCATFRCCKPCPNANSGPGWPRSSKPG